MRPAARGATGAVVLLAVLLVVTVLAAVPDKSNVVYALSLVAKVPLGVAGAIIGPLVSWPYQWTLRRLPRPRQSSTRGPADMARRGRVVDPAPAR